MTHYVEDWEALYGDSQNICVHRSPMLVLGVCQYNSIGN